MSAKHTLGPWTHTGREFNDVIDTEGDLVAVALHLRVGKTERSIREAEANARLIAAAPDLLDALNAMLTHMGMDEDDWNKPTFDKARAAIAKATGEKQ